MFRIYMTSSFSKKRLLFCLKWKEIPSFKKLWSRTNEHKVLFLRRSVKGGINPDITYADIHKSQIDAKSITDAKHDKKRIQHLGCCFILKQNASCLEKRFVALFYNRDWASSPYCSNDDLFCISKSSVSFRGKHVGSEFSVNVLSLKNETDRLLC